MADTRLAAPPAPAIGRAAATPSRGPAFLLLALAVALFATAWPVTKLGLGAGATPVWFAVARAALGSLATLVFLGATGRLRRPGRADLPIILTIGGLQLAAFFALTNLGLSLVPAGRSAVLAYTTTLWLVPLALLAGERIGRLRTLGVALGLAGIAVLLNPAAIDWQRRDILVGHGALLLAALVWAIAIFHARRHAWRLSPLELLPWQMLLATVLLLGLALATEPGGGIAPRPAVLMALAYLGILAGPLATWAATSVARALPTLVTSIGFLGVPALGIVLATLWLDEPITPTLALGALLVLAGLVLVAAASRSPRRHPARQT